MNEKNVGEIIIDEESENIEHQGLKIIVHEMTRFKV